MKGIVLLALLAGIAAAVWNQARGTDARFVFRVLTIAMGFYTWYLVVMTPKWVRMAVDMAAQMQGIK